MNTLAYYTNVHYTKSALLGVSMVEQSTNGSKYKGSNLEVNLIKLLWSKFTHSFCKLDCFTTRIFSYSALKRSSLQKEYPDLFQKRL